MEKKYSHTNKYPPTLVRYYLQKTEKAPDARLPFYYLPLLIFSMALLLSLKSQRSLFVTFTTQSLVLVCQTSYYYSTGKIETDIRREHCGRIIVAKARSGDVYQEAFPDALVRVTSSFFALLRSTLLAAVLTLHRTSS